MNMNMNENDFKKGIESLKNIRLEDSEKKLILARILATPVKSPYTHKIAYASFAFSLFLIVTSLGILNGSGSALPGDKLYGVKTSVVEPVLDAINSSPEDKVVWEEEKIDRRIMEAEALIVKDKLDDKKLETLKRSIEKSSKSFVIAADTVASSSVASTTTAKDRVNNLKLKLQKKVNKEKIKNLRDAAIRALENRKEEDEKGIDRDNRFD